MARRSSSPPPKQLAQLTPEELRRGIDRLTKLVDRVTQFDPQTVTEQYNIPELDGLSAAIEDGLARTFGPDTLDYERYQPARDFDNGPHNYAYHVSILDVRKSLERSKQSSIALLRQAIEALKDRLSETETQKSLPRDSASPSKLIASKVFIVHGHAGEPREAVARFLERIGLEPIILHERPNKGRTIITKFREEAADVGFAVIVMTPDDLGKAATDASEAKSRARQNVVFELGFFIGILGPDRVAALIKGEIERPSDFDGVVYISLETADWRTKLGQELQAAGYNIDWNKAMGS